MKTIRNKCALSIALIATVIGFAVSCNNLEEKTLPDKPGLQKDALGTTQEQNPLDGIYIGSFTYYGEKIAVEYLVENGEIVKTTMTDETGEPFDLKDVEYLGFTFYKEEAREMYLAFFEKYDCPEMTVASKPSFIRGENENIYTFYGGYNDKKGDCWYS